MAKQSPEMMDSLPEWDCGTYQTGSTTPPKQVSGLLTVLLLLLPALANLLLLTILQVLMTLGFLFKMEQEVAEEEEAECVDCEPEVEREIIPSIFEVMSTLAKQQAEEIFGPQEPDPVEECMSAEDMVLKMIQSMGGGLPS